MSETVTFTDEQRRELALLDFVPARPRCEVRWRRDPVDCGRDADGLIVCLRCGFSLTTSRVCWARTMLVAAAGEKRGDRTACNSCGAKGLLLNLFEFRPFGEVAS